MAGRPAIGAQAGRSITAPLAYRTARLAGVPIDSVLSGMYPSICPHCGRGSETTAH